jgi:hypothetical protein
MIMNGGCIVPSKSKLCMRSIVCALVSLHFMQYEWSFVPIKVISMQFHCNLNLYHYSLYSEGVGIIECGVLRSLPVTFHVSFCWYTLPVFECILPILDMMNMPFLSVYMNHEALLHKGIWAYYSLNDKFSIRRC